MSPAQTVQSVNPATEEVMATFPVHSGEEIDRALNDSREASRKWRTEPLSARTDLTRRVAAYLRQNKARLAATATAEMGKPIGESEAEIEKCAWNCEYFAEHGEEFLARENRHSSGTESYLQFVPLGTILAVMPWNFPFWQVFRFATPALLAGNTAVLKHARNVPQCALAIEEILRESGLPSHVFKTLLISSGAVEAVIEDSRIAALTLTGSDRAGRQAGSQAGLAIKKSVLELGGSDPFIVLKDADLDKAVETGIRARFQNTGQSCIAAKRFIIIDDIYREFEERFVEAVRNLKVGDPKDRSTQIGPMARGDLRDTVDTQVKESISQGARSVVGGRPRPGKGYFYEPTVLTEVHKNMTAAAAEEVFGPVAALMRARNTEEAILIANDTPYGLGANLWTGDLERARELAGQIEAGQVFINGMVASDPRLPFGGVKASGYGRELSDYGIREFVNIQTVWIGPQQQ